MEIFRLIVSRPSKRVVFIFQLKLMAFFSHDADNVSSTENISDCIIFSFPCEFFVVLLHRINFKQPRFYIIFRPKLISTAWDKLMINIMCYTCISSPGFHEALLIFGCIQIVEKNKDNINMCMKTICS